MASIIKANQLQDFGGNSIITSDGAGNVTPNADGIKNVPAFLASCSSGASLAATTWTKLNFTSENFDTNSAYDAANSKFTCPTDHAGKYVIGFNVRTDGATNQLRIIAAIKINGLFALYTEVIDDNNSQATAMGLQVSIVCDLAVNDYVEAYCYQNSGGTLTQIANIASQDPGGDQRFWGYKLIT
tara:strand:- start:62 stop:616 length:555 start_codon:yes stop_codon:yes gene_type:complete